MCVCVRERERDIHTHTYAHNEQNTNPADNTNLQQRGLDDLTQLDDLLLAASHVRVRDIGLVLHLQGQTSDAERGEGLKRKSM